MAAIPYQLHQAPNHKDLYQFLLACQRLVSKNHKQCVASISLAIDALDLLAVLNSVVRSDQRYFYFEKTGQEESILAFDVALQFEAEGTTRFQDAKAFVQTVTAQITQTGELSAPFAGAHFFCNFSFFDQATDCPAASVFLPRWQVAQSDRGSTVVANIVIDSDFNAETAVDDVRQMLRDIQSVKYKVVDLAIDTHRSFYQQQFVSKPDHFKASVAAALKLIQAKQFHKIVLADALDVTSPLPFNIVASLNNLRSRYPNCYVFSANTGNAETFIGASPERLVSIYGNRLSTEALAGSVPRGKTRAEDAKLAAALLGSQKEKHEHQVVIDSIAQHLKNLGLTPQFAPARLLQLPNIQHLQTPIRATVTSEVHLLDAVAELHPTPAVAGAPRTLACEQIRNFEAFERSLYAAPIGWVDAEGNGEFAVGIRSALIRGHHARLFAGAGIVAGSIPEKELAEVQLKLQALLCSLA